MGASRDAIALIAEEIRKEEGLKETEDTSEQLKVSGKKARKIAKKINVKLKKVTETEDDEPEDDGEPEDDDESEDNDESEDEDE